MFEPEIILAQLETEVTRRKFAEEQAAKIFNSTTNPINWAISPEPVKFDDTQPEVCGIEEHRLWKAAMDQEMQSMEEFGVQKGQQE